MIKAEELMVGDWVQNRLWTRCEKVRAIYTNGVVCNFQKDFSEIDPIPLTSDILLNNGFTQGFHTGWGANKTDHYTLRFDIDVTYEGRTETFTHEINIDHRRASDLWDVETTNGCRIYNIESVHELQHALRVGGIEQEIIKKIL